VTRAPASEPRAPRLGELQPAPRRDLVADLDWTDLAVTDDLAEAYLEQLVARGVHSTAASFVGARVHQARVIDCRFESCDLSGVHCDDGEYTRVEFRECRLSGAQFNSSRLHDVRFVRCRLDGANFRMAHGERVWFEDCVLLDAEFNSAQLAHARFDRCDLTNAEFTHAEIADASLAGSTLDGIRGVGGLQRPVIDASQVVAFAYSLMAVHGVVVRDPDGDE
jgi:uncharacterized protein YjbI with pentapeptide repeats